MIQYFGFIYANNLWFYQHINGMAQIKHAKHGVVDIDFVLGVGGYDLDRLGFVVCGNAFVRILII